MQLPADQAPDCSFHAQTRSTNLSRPSARRVRPSFASSRSTTICVAMPAWSLPGCQSGAPAHAVKPDQGVLDGVVEACPMCRLPVTFGGGMTMQ